MKRFLTPAVALAAVSLIATACGTTEDASSNGGNSGEQITLTDSRGEKVTLDGVADQTVGTEWNVVEHLVSLGVMPVGVADVEGYTAWVQSEPLDDSAKDIGTRGEPSIDTVAGLDADVIVATNDLPESAIAQLEGIAPVLVVNSADTKDQIGQMFANLDLIAQATGKQDEAAKLRADFDAKLAEGKAAIEAAGLSGKRFMLADGWVDSGNVSVRPFGQGSLAGEVVESLGLVNGWEGEVDPAYGLGSTDVEGLTQLNVDYFFNYGNKVEGEADAFVVLEDNDIWKGLPVVTSGGAHRLPDGIWMFGGPTSMTALVDAIVAAVTKQQG